MNRAVNSARRVGHRGLTQQKPSPGIPGRFKDSIALCHQVTTLDRGKLSQYLGQLPEDTLIEIEAAHRSGLSVSIQRDGLTMLNVESHSGDKR
jgi:PemK-like, MazF-like toxin of type II toxin-antitoxin system